MKADYVIKNGRVFDPAEKIDTVADLAIVNGKIAAIGKEFESDRVLDAKGCLVTPGAIDIHAHIFEDGVWNGMPADLAAIPMGVTAIVDAGSTGVSNYGALLKQCRANRIRSKIMLNVSACGIIMPTQFSEPVDPSIWNTALFDEAFANYGDSIIGLKLRINRAVVKELGLEPLKASVKLAERYGTRVIAHVTDAPESMSAVANCMRAGDVFCHVYHGTGHTIIGEDGKIEDDIWKARERGVIFDVASGRGNFSLAVAKAALEQGFLPDTISTDVTLQNWHNPIAGNLPIVMSRFLALGMSLEDVILRTTANPAKQFGVDGLGTLREGTAADISIFKLEEKQTCFTDKFGNCAEGTVEVVPKGTFIGGKLLYRAVDLKMV